MAPALCPFLTVESLVDMYATPSMMVRERKLPVPVKFQSSSPLVMFMAYVVPRSCGRGVSKGYKCGSSGMM